MKEKRKDKIYSIIAAGLGAAAGLLLPMIAFGGLAIPFLVEIPFMMVVGGASAATLVYGKDFLVSSFKYAFQNIFHRKSMKKIRDSKNEKIPSIEKEEVLNKQKNINTSDNNKTKANKNKQKR